MAIDFDTIRTRFINQNQTTYSNTATNYTLYGDPNYYNLDFYRSKYYYWPTTEAYIQFSAGTIDMAVFNNGATGNCQCTNCNCACNCANCGDGDTGGGGDAGECFIKGSLVLMADLYWKPIEDLQIGDHVYSYDASMKKTIGTVLKLHRTRLGTKRGMIEVTSMDGHQVIMTDDHPLWSDFGSKQGWGVYHRSEYLKMTNHPAELIPDTMGCHWTISDTFVPSFVERRPEYAHKTELYHAYTDTGNYIVDGFLVDSFEVK